MPTSNSAARKSEEGYVPDMRRNLVVAIAALVSREI